MQLVYRLTNKRVSFVLNSRPISLPGSGKVITKLEDKVASTSHLSIVIKHNHRDVCRYVSIVSVTPSLFQQTELYSRTRALASSRLKLSRADHTV